MALRQFRGERLRASDVLVSKRFRSSLRLAIPLYLLDCVAVGVAGFLAIWLSSSLIGPEQTLIGPLVGIGLWYVFTLIAGALVNTPAFYAWPLVAEGFAGGKASSLSFLWVRHTFWRHYGASLVSTALALGPIAFSVAVWVTVLPALERAPLWWGLVAISALGLLLTIPCVVCLTVSAYRWQQRDEYSVT